MSELRDRRYLSDPSAPVFELPAGDVTEGVVRVGDTVRRPHQPQSYAVAAYLDHLQRVGFEGAPRYLGRDEEGRDVLTFLEGDVAGAVVEPRFLGDEMLRSVARLVQRLHEASTGYDPGGEPFPLRPGLEETPQLVSHLDITPQNVVVRDGEAAGLIDFDLARPTTRFRDSYNAAMHWVPLGNPVDVAAGFSDEQLFARLRVFADAYGWSRPQRETLAANGATFADQSWERMRYRAEHDGGGWARMWNDGVGDLILRRRDWLLRNAERISRALVDGAPG